MKKRKSNIRYRVTYNAPHIFVYGAVTGYYPTLAQAKNWVKKMDKEYKDRETKTNKIEVTIQKVTKVWNRLNDQFIEEEA